MDNYVKITNNFHNKTCITSHKKFNDEIIFHEFTKKYYKNYSRFKQVPLKVKKLKKIGFQQILEKRRSERLIKPHQITYEELSSLLYYSAGENKFNNHRFYPSAGARYAPEIYLIINNVALLDQGLYHFSPQNNNLEYLWTYDNLPKKISRLFFNHDWIKNSSALIVVSAVIKRTQMKYRLRGYRYVLLDIGHLCQNIYLISTNLGLRCCSIGGFLDKELNKLFDLETNEETAMIVLALGK